MKRVTITDKSNELITTVEMDDPSNWLHTNISHNAWGRPERWQQEYKRYESPSWVMPYPLSDVLQDEDRVNDYDVIEHWVKLKADYNISIEDITYEYTLAQCYQNRLSEYPTMNEFMNAYFDGGQDALTALQAKRIDTKRRFPKPLEGD